MKPYPRHDIKCIIHVNSDLCNCGREEFEEEVAHLEEEDAIQEENTPLDSESQKAYNEAMSKDN